MVMIFDTEFKGLIAEEADRIYAKRNQAEVRNEIDRTLADMFKCGNSPALNVIKAASFRLLEIILIDLFSLGDADGVLSV